MGVFHVFKIAQMVPNRAKRLIGTHNDGIFKANKEVKHGLERTNTKPYNFWITFWNGYISYFSDTMKPSEI